MTAPAVVVTNEWSAVLTYLGLDPRSPETKALVLLCDRYGLDPLLNHAQIIATKNGFRPYITRDGLLEIEHRSGQLDGITVDEQRRNTSGDGWTAYVSVWRKDMTHPFRYGAQCKDTESQARAGNGPEMALARAERRALKRAFAIPADDGDTATSETVFVENDAPAIDVDNAPAIDVDGAPASVSDQSAAHREVAQWTDQLRAEFLDQWAIEDFGEPWPADAVADALERPFGEVGG